MTDTVETEAPEVEALGDKFRTAVETRAREERMARLRDAMTWASGWLADRAVELPQVLRDKIDDVENSGVVQPVFGWEAESTTLPRMNVAGLIMPARLEGFRALDRAAQKHNVFVAFNMVSTRESLTEEKLCLGLSIDASKPYKPIHNPP
jgi:hypothetical protein